MLGSELSDAWDEAQAALPPGWALVCVSLSEFLADDLGVQVEPGDWVALAATRDIQHVEGWGPSPARAMTHLAERLRAVGEDGQSARAGAGGRRPPRAC
jgi:hypothetical protein